MHLDVAVFTAPDGSGRGPGRHALFGTTSADRVLVVGTRGSGATYRFVLNTTSWFDLASGPRLPRPDLDALAARLNELEGADPAGAIAWRAQATASPSPELWHGQADVEMFAEHAPWLVESRLAPKIVKNALFDALRAAWTFPEEAEENPIVGPP